MILQAIRDKYPALDNLRIRSIVATQHTHTVDCVISCYNLASINYQTRKDIVSIVYGQTPKGYRMNCTFEDDNFTSTTFARFVCDTIASQFGIMGNVALGDISVAVSGDRCFAVTLSINTMQKSIYDQCQFATKFAEILSRYSCYSCSFSLAVSQVSRDSIDKIIANQDKLEQLSISRIVNAPSRHIAVDLASICYRGKVVSAPRYIFDIHNPAKKVTVCGVISGFTSKINPKNDKMTIIKFKLTDKSSSISVVLFSKQKEEDELVLRTTQDLDADKAIETAKRNKAYNDRVKTRLLHLSDGVTIAVEGKAVLNDFSNSIEIIADRVQTCRVREHQQDSYHDKAPENYKVIKPVIMDNTSEQQSLFGSGRYIADMLRTDIVVLELTTTGDNVFTDHILSVGCVKVSNGVVVARLSTMINPDVKFSPQLEKQLGVTSAELIYFPTLSEIIPDLYKFTEGCMVLGTNITNNIGMLQYYADGRQYLFDNDKQFYLDFVNNMLVAEDINTSFPVLKELYKHCNVVAPVGNNAVDLALLLANCMVSVVEH